MTCGAKSICSRSKMIAVQSTTLPLNGIRVLELGHIVAGPTASLILADLGADVIKVENPDGGDQARRMPGAGSGYYFFNRNKRSVAIDLKSPLGKALFLTLVRAARYLPRQLRAGRARPARSRLRRARRRKIRG